MDRGLQLYMIWNLKEEKSIASQKVFSAIRMFSKVKKFEPKVKGMNSECLSSVCR